MRKKLTQSSKNNWDSVYSTKPEKYKIIFNSPVIITFTILSFIVLILSYVTLGTSTNLFSLAPSIKSYLRVLITVVTNSARVMFLAR